MPDARDIPDPLALAHVRTLLAGGHAHQALETALAAAARRGTQSLDAARARAATVEQFLLALQAAAEELESIAAALAAGEGEAGG